MAVWIKCTDGLDGNPLWINLARATGIKRQDQPADTTRIFFRFGGQDSVLVNETPEEILVKTSGFAAPSADR